MVVYEKTEPMSEKTLHIKNLTIHPSLFLAPMAGITHSAFRRLLSDFGGYGALYTEMLSARAVASENVTVSPFTKRREQEGLVFYQLRLTGEEPIAESLAVLKKLNVEALDINCGCPAPEVAKKGGGFGLWNDYERFTYVVSQVRSLWDKALFIKCRLGAESTRWQEEFLKRLKFLENAGVDAIVLHPRFSRDKLKKRARWEYFPWVKQHTAMPLIANGDILSADSLLNGKEFFSVCEGIMLGRIAAVQPWIFSVLSGKTPLLDYGEIWQRFYRYVLEDFPPEKAIGRLKEFSAYFARNFMFGHELYRAAQGAQSVTVMKERVMSFLERKPRLVKNPSVSGI